VPTLRPATLADVPAMVDTVQLGFASYESWAPRGWDPPSPAIDRASIRAKAELPGTWCLIAEEGGEPAGHVALTPARELALLWMLFVREPWWGSGLAVQLLGRAVAEAAARGFATMRLETPAGAGRARRFYEREGWLRSGPPEYAPALGLEVVEYRRSLPV
jgi:GNAT superfamily N-acetyltransferase